MFKSRGCWQVKVLLVAALVALASCAEHENPAQPVQRPVQGGTATQSEIHRILTDPSTYKYKHSETLVGSTKALRQGKRLDGGGCSFSRSFNLRKGETITEIELAFDPETCRSVVAVQSTGESFTSTLGLRTAGVPAPDVATLHSWWADPVGLHVNDMTNVVGWNGDGTCAAPPWSAPFEDFDYDLLEQTGWYLGFHLWDHGANCDGVVSQSDARFINDTFCATLQTNTYYQPNFVEGLPDGSADFESARDKDGICSFLLSSNFTAGVE